MTTFKDGPAQGRHLMLRRGPVFLRVTRDRAGECDALDQLDDSPRPDEQMTVYRLTERPGICHLSTRGKGGKRFGGIFVRANYALCETQPDDSIMRDNALWASWCNAQMLPPELDELRLLLEANGLGQH